MQQEASTAEYEGEVRFVNLPCVGHGYSVLERKPEVVMAAG